MSYGNAGVSGLINEEDVLQYIKFLMREANNPRNDGWVQKGYREKLTKIRDELNRDYHASQYSPYSGTWYPSTSTTSTITTNGQPSPYSTSTSSNNSCATLPKVVRKKIPKTEDEGDSQIETKPATGGSD